MTCLQVNDENTVDWLTSGKIHSYVQRLDEVRKYAFGTMNVIPRPRKATTRSTERGSAVVPMVKHILAAHEESETFGGAHDFEKISEESTGK